VCEEVPLQPYSSLAVWTTLPPWSALLEERSGHGAKAIAGGVRIARYERHGKALPGFVALTKPRRAGESSTEKLLKDVEPFR